MLELGDDLMGMTGFSDSELAEVLGDKWGEEPEPEPAPAPGEDVEELPW